MRSYRKVIFTLLLIIILIFLSHTVRSSIRNSLLLCVKVLIPALFPFFIISGMLLDFGFDQLISSHISTFCIGLLCGYPIGTKTVCNNYHNHRLTKNQAEALLTCTANASPAFVVIALGETLLKSKSLGLLLLLAQSLNALIIFLLLVPKTKSSGTVTADSPYFIPTLVHSTKSAGEQMIFVCGITVVFGIICDLLRPLLNGKLIKLLGLIEIIHGCEFLESSDVLLAATILGFSGLCVITQCIYYIQETNLNIFYLILGKLYSSINIPFYLIIFISSNIFHKIISVAIIILTNVVTMCIIKSKGCDNKYDFFKKNRKMLRLLRTSNQNNF